VTAPLREVGTDDPDDLYGLPLERFTEERNALVRRLRAEERREEAAEVSKLRKPSVAAWAVNQLVRTQRPAINALFVAGDELQKAQRDLLAGRSDPGALRTAAESERKALDQLNQTARGLLSSAGQELTGAKLEQVSETLHAAALDEEARNQVRDGCLHRELRHIGLGAVGATVAGGPRRRAGNRGAADRRRADTVPKRDQDRAAARRAEQLKAARKVEAEARRRMERADRDLDAAEKRRDRAAAALREAGQELGRARTFADETVREHQRTRSQLAGS